MAVCRICLPISQNGRCEAPLEDRPSWEEDLAVMIFDSKPAPHPDRMYRSGAAVETEAIQTRLYAGFIGSDSGNRL